MQTYYYFTNELYHHGIKGQRWGVRRFQNEDGSLTEKGRKRYGEDLDINDTDLQNVANIRYGESRRRYEAAKLSKADKYTRKELKSNMKEAKKLRKQIHLIKEGKKLADEGKSIAFNEAKIEVEKNKQRIMDLLGKASYDAERLDSQLTVRKLEKENQRMKAYEDTQRKYGPIGAKSLGGKEYQDVLARRGNK